MTHELPRWFRALFPVLMLVFCVAMALLLVQAKDLRQQIARVDNDAEQTLKRLPLQQREYAEYSAELPQLLAELEAAAPLAEAAIAQASDMKAQRRALREENAALKAQLEDLRAQVAEAQQAALEAEARLHQLRILITALEQAHQPHP